MNLQQHQGHQQPLQQGHDGAAANGHSQGFAEGQLQAQYPAPASAAHAFQPDDDAMKYQGEELGSLSHMHAAPAAHRDSPSGANPAGGEQEGPQQAQHDLRLHNEGDMHEGGQLQQAQQQGQGDLGVASHAHHLHSAAELPNVLLAQQQLMAQHMQQEQAQHAQHLQLLQGHAEPYGASHHPHLQFQLQHGALGGGEAGAATQQQQQPSTDAAGTAGMTSHHQHTQQLGQHSAAMALAAQDMQQLEGQPVTVALPILADMQSLAFDPATIAAATAAGTAVTIPLSMLEGLTPEHLHMLGAGNGFSLVAAPPGGFGMSGGQHAGEGGGAGEGSQYKNWWDEEHEKELLELVNNREYCKQRLGIEELDWGVLEQHFNRSQNALRKKYWMLTKAQQAQQASSGSSPKLRAERKCWSDQETAELARLTQDPQYLREVLGIDDVDWEKLAAHFNTNVVVTKRKYRHIMEQQALAQQQAQQVAAQTTSLPPQLAALQAQHLHQQQQAQAQLQAQHAAASVFSPGGLEKGKRQHHRKNVPYRWMIVSAMSNLDNLEGTAIEIFQKIESTPQFLEQLDTRIMPGTKHVPRWKIQVRKVLSADNIFLNTGRKHKHETIWRLNPDVLQEGQADRQRQRAGVSPISLPTAEAGAQPSVGMASQHAQQQHDGAELAHGALHQQQQAQQGMHLPEHLMHLQQLAAQHGLAQHELPAELLAQGGVHGLDPHVLQMLTAQHAEQGAAQLMGQQHADHSQQMVAGGDAAQGQEGGTHVQQAEEVHGAM